ncbi:MAG: phosphoribosylanthranilate isomerase [Gammaproteobacteria bacterium]|nr:phosphoribosylanthranilate isomerase [Gammaproteobacteria bacterium]
MFVKICGLTDRAAIDAAVEAGADALGFLFAESPRQIEPARARELSADLPPTVRRVAVMHHPSTDVFRRVVDEFDPDWIQTDAEDFAEPAITALLAACRAECIPVFREGDAIDTLPERAMFEGRVSGSGETADWDEARRLARRCELILAGGLSPDNVASAIRQVRPWGVDVSSGVEITRGKKDPRKITDFIARVRAVENER